MIIGSYGLMMALGYLTALWVIYRQSGPSSISGDDMLDLLFWILVSSILGSRAFYVIMNPDVFSGRFWAALKFWDGGFVFYGGVIAALVAGAVVVRMKKISFSIAADAVAPGLSIGHAMGRIGCFGVGCCWGKVSTGFLSARFPVESVAFDELQKAGALGADAIVTPPLHPVQLYEAVGECLIFMVLVFLRGKKPFHGAVILCYLILYGVLRFLTEIFRGDPMRGFVTEWKTPFFNRLLGLSSQESSFFSTSQLISVILVFSAATAFFLFFRRQKNSRISRSKSP